MHCECTVKAHNYENTRALSGHCENATALGAGRDPRAVSPSALASRRRAPRPKEKVFGSLRSPSMSDFWSESLQSAKQIIAQDERLAWINAVL